MDELTAQEKLTKARFAAISLSAWTKSGNSVPIDMNHRLKISGDKIVQEIVNLEAILTQ